MVFVSGFVSSIIIAIVQGLTEWMPISSSGHLVIFEKWLDFSGGLQFDVALHFGTLMAVFVYFGSDIIDIIRDVVSGKWKTENGKMGWMILLATIPAGIVGYLLRNVFEVSFMSLEVVAMGFAVSGIFLIIASVGGTRKKGKLSYGKALVIGVAQVFALFPGISRSGSTIGSGALLGLDDKSAIKFSFLMSIPIIIGANVLAIGDQTLPANLVWATIASFIVGLLTIHLLYGRMLASKKSLKWYGIYALTVALILGLILLI